jgi:hypothetical protein
MMTGAVHAHCPGGRGTLDERAPVNPGLVGVQRLEFVHHGRLISQIARAVSVSRDRINVRSPEGPTRRSSDDELEVLLPPLGGVRLGEGT